jgi:hypothetical protein
VDNVLHAAGGYEYFRDDVFLVFEAGARLNQQAFVTETSRIFGAECCDYLLCLVRIKAVLNPKTAFDQFFNAEAAEEKQTRYVPTE